MENLFSSGLGRCRGWGAGTRVGDGLFAVEEVALFAVGMALGILTLWTTSYRTGFFPLWTRIFATTRTGLFWPPAILALRPLAILALRTRSCCATRSNWGRIFSRRHPTPHWRGVVTRRFYIRNELFHPDHHRRTRRQVHSSFISFIDNLQLSWSGSVRWCSCLVIWWGIIWWCYPVVPWGVLRTTFWFANHVFYWFAGVLWKRLYFFLLTFRASLFLLIGFLCFTLWAVAFAVNKAFTR